MLCCYASHVGYITHEHQRKVKVHINVKPSVKFCSSKRFFGKFYKDTRFLFSVNLKIVSQESEGAIKRPTMGARFCSLRQKERKEWTEMPGRRTHIGSMIRRRDRLEGVRFSEHVLKFDSWKITHVFEISI